MTGCLTPSALAVLANAAADADRPIHLAACARCRALVAELRGTVIALGTLRVPALGADHRAQLADAVLVAAQQIAPHVERSSGRRQVLYAVGLAAAAACMAVAVVSRGPSTKAASAPPVVAMPARLSVVPIQPPPARQSTSVHSLAGTTYEIDRTADHQTLHVHGGEGVVIESATAIDVDLGATVIALAPGRFELRLRHGVIASVQVFAGYAQIKRDRDVTRVFAGETWDLPVAPPPTILSPVANLPLRQPATVSGKEWFRLGWLALREHREHDAIAAFDHADDPSIAEDAAFWAAVAAERAGDRASALERFERFVAAFPHSEHAAAATARLR